MRGGGHRARPTSRNLHACRCPGAHRSFGRRAIGRRSLCRSLGRLSKEAGACVGCEPLSDSCGCAADRRRRAATGATRGGRVQPGNGAHMSSRASRGVGGGKGGGNMEQAFDFEKMLAGFDKIAMEREAAKKVKSTEYDKTSSFFDTLDEQVDEKRKGGRVFMAEMRKVDALTFGEELIRQRGRGGGKGGKGLARGNGRDGGRGAMGQKGNGKGAGRGGVRTNGGGKGGDRRPRNTDVDTFGDMARTSGRARDGRSGRAGDGGRGGARGGGRGQAAVATGAAPVPPVVPASA